MVGQERPGQLRQARDLRDAVSRSAARSVRAWLPAIQSDTEVCDRVRPCCASERLGVVSRNLLLIPIENSLLYVRPLYVRVRRPEHVPQMQRVIVAYQPGGDGTLTVKIAPDAPGCARRRLFGSSSDGVSEDPGAGPETPTTPSGPDGPRPARPPRSRRSSTRSTMRTPTYDAALDEGDLSGAAGSPRGQSALCTRSSGMWSRAAPGPATGSGSGSAADWRHATTTTTSPGRTTTTEEGEAWPQPATGWRRGARGG